jgi:tetratricopeptide (TPR) repeat protein
MPVTRALLSTFLMLSVFPIAARPQSPPVAAAAQDAYAKEPYVFELLQNKVRFEADGKGQRELTIRVRVQSQSAVRELGLLVYPFASSFESLDIVYARVRKPDGTVIDTPPSDVQELDSAVSREAPMYTDEREKHVAIKSLSVGDILEARLRWTIHDPMAPGHFWFDVSHFKNGVCLKELIEIDVPRATPVKFHYAEPQAVIRQEGERRIYTFETANLKKPAESKIPAWEKNFHGSEPPDLRFTSFSSWVDVGEWFSALEKSQAIPSPEIRAKAEELTKGKATDDEKIHALYDFVSTHIRYIGVSLGLGRYAPHAAADVLSNRYGDCKDKHTLFQALLQAIGIPAYPALIGSQFRLDDSLPSPSTFDHLITAIPKGDKLEFLDTTPEVAPFGLLLANLRDRQALVLPAGRAAMLVNTPADPPFHSYEIFLTDSAIDSTGTLDAKMSMEERGDGEVIMRSAYRATPQNKWDELTQKIVNGMGFGGTVSEVSVSQPEDTAKPFTLSFTYHRTDFPDWKNYRVVLPAPAIFLAELTEEQKISKDAFPLGPLEEITYDSVVKLPDEFSLVRPDDLHRSSDFADFDATYAIDKPNVLHGILHFKTKMREIPGNERTKFSELANTIGETARRYVFVKGPNQPLSVMGGVISPFLQSGQIMLPIPALEKLVADRPDAYGPKLALSKAYVTAGRAKDATDLLEKAIAEDSSDAPILYYGLGKAYLSVPDPEKAFTTYQKALGDDPDPELLNNVAWDLGDLKVHLNDALGFANRAVAKYASQSTEITPEDAETSDFLLMPKLAAAWDTLGWIKFRADDAAAAEGYLQAAWDLSQAPVIGEHLVEVEEKLGKSKNAAVVCNMALAAGRQSEISKKLSDEMENLRKYLKPAAGQQARGGIVDGAMALSDIRTLHVPFHAKLPGNSSIAHFVVTISTAPQGNSAYFSSGAPELRNAVADLAAVKYPQSFADATPLRIIRKATLSCSSYTKDCVLVLLPIADAAVPDH